MLSDAQLALTNATCSPAPAGYQTVCDDLPIYSNATSLKPAPEFVADTNGDGLDTLEFRGDTTARILGIGDFLGNGRQLPLFTPSDSVNLVAIRIWLRSNESTA